MRSIKKPLAQAEAFIEEGQVRPYRVLLLTLVGRYNVMGDCWLGGNWKTL